MILSSTEIEAQFRGIYLLNTNSEQKNNRLSTKAYFLLKDPLKLDQYKVEFNLYPWLGTFSPFLIWCAPETTGTLKWYDEYNAVKHDREREFELGNLANVLNAIAAFAILLTAQYGPYIPYWRNLIGQFFTFIGTPQWELEDKYLPPFKGDD